MTGGAGGLPRRARQRARQRAAAEAAYFAHDRWAYDLLRERGFLGG